MEDEDDIEGFELLACDREGETDENGVEDDAEFEDEDGGELSGVVFCEVGVAVFASMTEVVFPWEVVGFGFNGRVWWC